MKRTRAIAMLLVPVLAVGGLTAGAVVVGEQSSARTAAAEAYADGLAAAQAAIAEAVELLGDLQAADRRAADAIAAAEAVVGSPEGSIEADDLADLRTLLDQVVSLRSTPEPDGSGIMSLDGAVSALTAAMYSTASTAHPTAQGVLDGNTGASAESRDALTAALAALDAALDERGDAAAAVSAVAAAAQGVRDSQAAADAAAVGSGGGGFPFDRDSYEWAYYFCHDFLLQWALTPLTNPITGEEIPHSLYPCTYNTRSGNSWTFYS